MLKQSLASMVLATSLATATTPRTDFDDYALPDVAADTLHTTTESIVHYGDNPAMTPQYIQLLISTGYVQDEAAQTLTMTQTGHRTLGRNQQGVIVEAHDFVTMYGLAMPQGDWALSLDGQGRPSMETWTEDDQVDSTLYAWTHPKCPDQDIRDADGDRQKLTWSVDGSGNCATGVYSQYSSTGQAWTDSVRIASWLWESGMPVQEVVYTTSGGSNDTSGITRIVYAAGIPVQKKRWAKEGFLAMMLAESCLVTSEASAFAAQTCVTFLDDNSGRISERRILSTSASAASVAPRRTAPSDRIRAWSSRGAFRFLNQDASAHTIDLRTIDGALLGRYRIEAGQELAVPAAAAGAAWRSVGPSASAGLLVAPR